MEPDTRLEHTENPVGDLSVKSLRCVKAAWVTGELPAVCLPLQVSSCGAKDHYSRNFWSPSSDAATGIA